MKQISQEQGIALINEFRENCRTRIGITEEDLHSFQAEMEGKPFAYFWEGSITEPLSEGADRLGKLLQMLKLEMDAIGKAPRFFLIQILMSRTSELQMDEMNAMNEFVSTYENVGFRWAMSATEEKPPVIKMMVIVVTD